MYLFLGKLITTHVCPAGGTKKLRYEREAFQLAKSEGLKVLTEPRIDVTEQLLAPYMDIKKLTLKVFLITFAKSE